MNCFSTPTKGLLEMPKALTFVTISFLVPWLFQIIEETRRVWGFPGSSAGKESTCNAGDPGLIPGSGKTPGKGTGYPLQYFWASLVPQSVKNPPAMQETLVRSLGWEDPLEEGTATHYRILAWRIPMDRGA